jgi:hypothetical protein
MGLADNARSKLEVTTCDFQFEVVSLVVDDKTNASLLGRRDLEDLGVLTETSNK